MPIWKKKSPNQSMNNILSEFDSGNKLKLTLNDENIVFDDGIWKNENSENVNVSLLVKKNKELAEENNFLKLKVEILLLMLAETTAKFGGSVSLSSEKN